MTTPVEYVENIGEYKMFRRPVQRRGIMQLAPGQSPSGYGNKISSDYILQFKDKPTKYRVYTICHSNNGSNYIIMKGKRVYIRTTWFSSEIPDEPK